MAVIPNNNSPPCFCNGDCPPGTRPYRKYAMMHLGITPPPGYDDWKLFEIAAKGTGGFSCQWTAVEPQAPGGLQQLTKTPPPVIPEPDTYVWQVVVPGSLQTTIYELKVTWDPDDAPFEPADLPPNCDAQSIFMIQISPVPTFAEGMLMHPVPEYMCTDADVRKWIVGKNFPPTEASLLQRIDRTG